MKTKSIKTIILITPLLPLITRTMKCIILTLIFFTASISVAQPTVSFTFDDGSLSKRANYEFEEWNDMILSALDDAQIKAIIFVKTEGKSTDKGKHLLETWNDKGHLIANHTYSHPNFNKEEINAEDFRTELLRADSLISSYSNYVKLFRFPYLKEGNTREEIDSIRQIMKSLGYKNGYVTIDASDWFISSRLRKRLGQNPNASIEAFKNFYLEHLFERASYYENLSYELTGRHIKHTLLLHHNLAAALFLDDLIAMFKSKGWKVVSADEAFKDPIFEQTPNHAGESIIWALAKDSGKYEDQLRYPAEDSRYEQARMDELGL
ncbi:polysaccharide deacetylase [Leeuwenhoekiella aestuarii]|uniref:polysaccharide deacetylase family protein n=1 Tax=Leeuwenhoekiella aestuarii TaxID=2249426 RepID=UPI000FFF08F6|nr:polysaccharide deacetylase family protein [Leeuwenhoekiella aestuarii]RXG14646.1 polysaccharide deacetylase [Leeuwenhoekiella aestuarii]